MFFAPLFNWKNWTRRVTAWGNFLYKELLIVWRTLTTSLLHCQLRLMASFCNYGNTMLWNSTLWNRRLLVTANDALTTIPTVREQPPLGFQGAIDKHVLPPHSPVLLMCHPHLHPAHLAPWSSDRCRCEVSVLSVSFVLVLDMLCYITYRERKLKRPSLLWWRLEASMSTFYSSNWTPRRFQKNHPTLL